MSDEIKEKSIITGALKKGLTTPVVPTVSQITETPINDQTISTTIPVENPNIDGDKK